MSARRQGGSLQRRKRAGVWKWMALWWEDDHRRARTLGTCNAMTKAEAEDKLREIIQPVNEQSGAVEYTLQGFARQVVFPWYRRSWKPSTAMTTEDRVDYHILREIGNKKLSALNRTALQDFLDHKATQHRKPDKDGNEGPLLSHSTLAHLRWDLRQLFQVAVNDGLLRRNPAELLHVPKGVRHEKGVLTIGQAQWILAVLDLRERLIVKLAGICGMRPGEIVALQWKDIGETSLTVERRIYRGKIDTPKTQHSTRAVALPKSVVIDINEWRTIARNTAPDAWVFPSENGKTPLWANNAWDDKIRPTLNPLGLGWVNYQVLRRSAVSLLNAQGADGTIVAAQCGHTVDTSINVYNKVGIERQLAAVQTLDNALAAPIAPVA